MRVSFIILVLFILKVFAYEVHNGETFVLSVPKGTKIYKKNKELSLVQNPVKSDEKLLILPVGYRDEIRDIVLTKKYNNKTKSIVISVKRGNYKKERLKVAKNKVNPPKKLLDKIYKDYKLVQSIYKKQTLKPYFSKSFILPLDSKITSRFGNARVFNETLKSYHSGVDFRASVGTPIRASNDGIVVLVKEMYYTGKSIIIDHGGGIFSSYSHLNRANVKVGDFIKRGEIIAHSGVSGRITGPHLHYTITINSKKVNPILFTKSINSFLRLN